MTVENKKAYQLYNEIIAVVENEFLERKGKEDFIALEKAYVLVAIAMVSKLARGVANTHGRDRFYDWWDEVNKDIDKIVNEASCEMTKH